MGVYQLMEGSLKDHAKECLSMVRGARVMTLASCDAQGPWSAPVYYIWEHPGFYFFSNPGARHILAAAGQLPGQGHESGKGAGQVADQEKMTAASIYKDDKDPTQLEGVQMSGIVKKASINTKSLGVAKTYCRKFDISGARGNLLEFFLSHFHAVLYWFEPWSIYYMDNRRGMGTREKIVL